MKQKHLSFLFIFLQVPHRIMMLQIWGEEKPCQAFRTVSVSGALYDNNRSKYVQF